MVVIPAIRQGTVPGVAQARRRQMRFLTMQSPVLVGHESELSEGRARCSPTPRHVATADGSSPTMARPCALRRWPTLPGNGSAKLVEAGLRADDVGTKEPGR